MGDIGRHGDSKTNIFTNLTQGAMQGHSETTWVIQVDIGTLKLLIVKKNLINGQCRVPLVIQVDIDTLKKDWVI